MHKMAVGYVRISLDAEGERVGVERQREDIAALAEREGLKLVHIYEDNDIGASTLSSKPRPDYQEMMKRAWDGEFDAMLAYSNSRLTRRPRELEEHITLYQFRAKSGRPLRIATVVSGEDDLSTADGRFVARVKANADAAEAERLGERLARAHKKLADDGKPVGSRRPFGFEADRVTHHPKEAPALQAVAKAVIGGATIQSQANLLNELGFTTTAGKKWVNANLSRTLRNPRYAGFLSQAGNKVHLHSKTGEPVKGQWEPLWDEETFDRLNGRRGGIGPTATHGGRGRHKTLLSGLLVCGVCGSGMSGQTPSDGKLSYRCAGKVRGEKHFVSINGAKAEEAVVALMFAYLKEERLRLDGQSSSFPQQGELVDLEERHRALTESFANGSISVQTAMPLLTELDRRMVALKQQRREWLKSATPSVSKELSQEEWMGWSLPDQRSTLSTVFEQVIVKPPQKRGPHFEVDRLVPVPRRNEVPQTATQ